MAHDFNNLLTVISGYARMGLDDLPAQHNLRESLTEIDKSAGRATSLTRQLLAFSRNRLFEAKTVVIDDVIRDFEKMLSRIIGEDIELHFVLGANGGAIRTEAEQIEQIILNLAVNARGAMPDAGRLVLETKRLDTDADFAAAHPGVRPGPHVVLAVSDACSACPRKSWLTCRNRSSSRRKPGKEPALACPLCTASLSKAGAPSGSRAMWARAARSTWCFRLHKRREGGSGGITRPEFSGAETILRVEDEAGLRKYLRQALERHGYRVVEAASGREAVELAQRDFRDVHLLLTDMVMSEMGGAELAAFFSHGPRVIPVLCMSGYSDRAWRPQCPTAGFIQKPFTIDALLSRIRQLLAAPSERLWGAGTVGTES